MSTPAENTSPQADHLFESLLPFRILAHATLALLYMPMVAAYLTIDFSPVDLTSLLAFGILGILGLVDCWIFLQNSSTVLTVLFAVVDVLLVLALPLCLWDIAIQGFFFATDFKGWDKGDDTIDVEFGILTLVPVILSLLYLIIVGVVAFCHRKWGIQSLRYTAGGGYRDGMKKHCSYFLFHHSYFRKHSFEPVGIAIFRGSMTVLACVGLLVFSIYSGLDQQEIYDNGSRSISETSIPAYIASSDGFVLGAGGYSISDNPTLSVTMSTPDSSPIPTDISVWQQSNGSTAGAQFLQAHTNSTSSLPNQVWYCPPETDGCIYFPLYDGYSSTAGTGFNVSWSGTTNMLIWPTVAQGIAWIDSIQVNYTQPMVLSADTHHNVLLTIVSYQRGNINWLFFDSQIVSAVAATSSSASFTFTPFQQVVVQQNLSSQSIFVLIGNFLSKIGGIFAAIDGVYAILFGRTVLATVMGSRPISPFGLFGIMARRKLQKLIHERFPKLRDDIDAPLEERGMMAYVNEVAIDTGYIRSDRASKVVNGGDNRQRNRISGGSQESRLSTQKVEV